MDVWKHVVADYEIDTTIQAIPARPKLKDLHNCVNSATSTLANLALANLALANLALATLALANLALANLALGI